MQFTGHPQPLSLMLMLNQFIANAGQPFVAAEPGWDEPDTKAATLRLTDVSTAIRVLTDPNSKTTEQQTRAAQGAFILKRVNEIIAECWVACAKDPDKAMSDLMVTTGRRNGKNIMMQEPMDGFMKLAGDPAERIAKDIKTASRLIVERHKCRKTIEGEEWSYRFTPPYEDQQDCK